VIIADHSGYDKPMFELRCTVRGCQQSLAPRKKAGSGNDGRSGNDGLWCAAGHHFDRARQGYWNLLQPQDRRSQRPGDSDAAVLARGRWLARGHAVGLIECLQPWIAASRRVDASVSTRTIDLGCGEGSFAPALFANESTGYCGIDLSKLAIKTAARCWPSATWVLANADRILPAADRSVDRVVSLFGRRPVAEIERVLTADGVCIVAVPGQDDLIELRERVQQSGHRRSRWETVVQEMAACGLRCIDHQLWQQQLELDPDAISDALAMTYRAGRWSEQAVAQTLSSMTVTVSADLILLRRGNTADDQP
jgi:23S rRNA (guanine745-N1)-methyltransferase